MNKSELSERDICTKFITPAVIDAGWDFRGSAAEDSGWREILEYFSSATQLGMTATPKETEYVSNIDYFGAPVYTYSLREGIEDGFLAPYKVIKVHLDVDIEGYHPAKGETDKYGQGRDLAPFDLICHVAFDQPPLTRRERAEKVRKRDVFTKYGERARAVLEALLQKYQDEGVTEISDPQILRLPPLDTMGTPVELVRAFGGLTQFESAVHEVQAALYEDVA